MDAKFLNMTIHSKAKEIKELAQKTLVCKRKAVGCAILELSNNSIQTWTATNGPSHEKTICTNEKGNCGCAHAEPRAIMNYLRSQALHSDKCILITTFSSCTSCTNMIIDSGLFGLCIYEIFAEHWSQADAMLRKVMPVWELKEVTTEKVSKWMLAYQ